MELFFKKKNLKYSDICKVHDGLYEPVRDMSRAVLSANQIYDAARGWLTVSVIWVCEFIMVLTSHTVHCLHFSVKISFDIF